MKIVNDGGNNMVPMTGCGCSTGMKTTKKSSGPRVCACQCSYGKENKHANAKLGAYK